jgi:hypothetical protein
MYLSNILKKRKKTLAGEKRVFVLRHWVQRKLSDASNRASPGDNKKMTIR